MTDTKTFEAGSTVVLMEDGSKWVVEGYAKSWYTLKNEDGDTKKVRAKQIAGTLEDLELEEENDGKMSTTLRKYRQRYQPAIAYSGRKSYTTGDEIAHELAGLSPMQVIRVAEKLLDMEQGELLIKYEKLNAGQKRMNAGNRIRAAIKRGDATVDDLKKALH